MTSRSIIGARSAESETNSASGRTKVSAIAEIGSFWTMAVWNVSSAIAIAKTSRPGRRTASVASIDPGPIATAHTASEASDRNVAGWNFASGDPPADA